MKLSDLDPEFIRREIRPCTGQESNPECSTSSAHTEHEYWILTDSIAEADGVRFLCPKCFITNNGSVGTHSVMCWRPRVPADVSPKPGRWEFEGTGLNDLTLRAGSSSVLLVCECKEPCKCCKAHFFITNGGIEGLT